MRAPGRHRDSVEHPALGQRNRQHPNNANPRGLIRHSSFPRPTAHVSWQLVLDQEALDLSDHACAAPIYDRNAVLTLISHDFYPGARREMLHETNRRDVITNLLVWISEILENRS
jgi:hypothetical protein